MSLREQLQQTLGTAYRLERELGGGGMSRVFLAEETALGRRVVVKVLPPEIAAGVNADRFKREIQVAARLQHPHIVPVLSAGEMDGVPYYTMPFVEGESVRARFGKAGGMSITEAIGIMRDVAKALAYAHERGIVHRDIKPDNVLLSGGSATVTDFGIAKAIAAARSDGGAAVPTLTSIGSSIGTPAYMAPEQAAADPGTNHRADLYSFGCMAYELLAGRPPFVEKSPQRLLAAQMSDAPQPIQALRPDTPPALADLVMRCLAKDADARPQSAGDLVQVLETVTSAGTHTPMPGVLLGGQGMLRKALLAYVAAFIFVAVLAKTAIVAVGLPDWVFPGALVVMALGLPVILFTAYVHSTARRLVTQTPTYTPGGSPAAAVPGTMATIAVKASPHVSWRRTWLGGVFAVGAFVVLIGAYMALRAMGIGPFGSLLAAGTLQRNERLLVTDFTSNARDSTIGPVVTDAFRTALGQSRSVGIMQPTDVREVLRRMQRPTSTPVDFAVAREIATREGIKAIVDGQVIAVGGSYVIAVQLLTPQREQLATFRETAAGEQALLAAIDELARDLRAKIGESLKLVQATPPLERVTTPSLEALKKYVQGSRVLSYESDWAKGAALLEEAIALDTGFAMAYRRLAVEYSNRQQDDRAMALLQKAYDHSDRLSDAERYLVLGSYYQRGPRQDLAKSTSAYEMLIELQPDFVTALNNVVINYRDQRNWVKAEEYLQRAIAIGQAPVVTYNQLIWTLWNQGKSAEAWAAVALLDSVYPGNPERVMRRAQLLNSERRFDSAAALLQGLIQQRPNDAPIRAISNNVLAMQARARGRLREADRWTAEMVAVNVQRGAPQARVLAAASEAAARTLFLGDSGRAVAILDRALTETPLERLPEAVRPYVGVAAAYAVAGRPDRARAILALFERGRRDVVRSTDAAERHEMQGMIAFSEGRYDDAVRELQGADQGEWPSAVLPMLAEAYDRSHNADSAIAVYERYVAVRDPFRVFTDQWFLARAHRRAGELYEAKADVVNAVKHYEQFVELWRGADPELQPQVAAVRARLSRLKDSERGMVRP